MATVMAAVKATFSDWYKGNAKKVMVAAEDEVHTWAKSIGESQRLQERGQRPTVEGDFFAAADKAREKARMAPEAFEKLIGQYYRQALLLEESENWEADRSKAKAADEDEGKIRKEADQSEKAFREKINKAQENAHFARLKAEASFGAHQEFLSSRRRTDAEMEICTEQKRMAAELTDIGILLQPGASCNGGLSPTPAGELAAARIQLQAARAEASPNLDKIKRAEDWARGLAHKVALIEQRRDEIEAAIEAKNVELRKFSGAAS